MNEHHDIIRKVYVTNNSNTNTISTPIKTSENSSHSSKNKPKKSTQDHQLQYVSSTPSNISPQKQMKPRQILLLNPLVQPVALRKRPQNHLVNSPTRPPQSKSVMLSNKPITTSNPNQQNPAIITTTAEIATSTIPERPTSPKSIEEFPAPNLAPIKYLRSSSTSTNRQSISSNSQYLVEGSMSFKEQPYNQIKSPSAVFYGEYTNTSISNQYPSYDSSNHTQSTSSSSLSNATPLLRILQNRLNRVTSKSNNDKNSILLSNKNSRNNSCSQQYISHMNTTTTTSHNNNNKKSQQRSYSGTGSQILMHNSSYSFGCFSSSSSSERCAAVSSLQATPQQYFYDQQSNTPTQFQLQPIHQPGNTTRFPVSRNRMLTSPNDRKTIARQQNLNSSFAKLRIANTTAAFSFSPFDHNKQSPDQIRTTNPFVSNEDNQREIASSIIPQSNSFKTIQNNELLQSATPDYIPQKELQEPSSEILDVHSQIDNNQNTNSTIEGSIQHLTKHHHNQPLTTSLNASRTTGALVLPQIQLIFIDEILSSKSNPPNANRQRQQPQSDTSEKQSLQIILKRKNQLRINLEKHMLSLLHESVQQIVDFDFLQRIHPYINEIIKSEPYIRSEEHHHHLTIEQPSMNGQSNGNSGKYTLAEVSKWTLLKQLQQYESGQLSQTAFFGFIMNYFLPPLSYRQRVVQILLESINETLNSRSIQLTHIHTPITQLFDIQGNPINDLYSLDLTSTILLASSQVAATTETIVLSSVAVATGILTATQQSSEIHLTEQIKQKLLGLHLAYQKKHASNYKQAKVQSAFVVVATNEGTAATREVSKTMKLPEILLKNNPAFQYISYEANAKKKR